MEEFAYFHPSAHSFNAIYTSTDIKLTKQQMSIIFQMLSQKKKNYKKEI